MFKNIKEKALGGLLLSSMYIQCAFADAKGFETEVTKWGDGWIGVALKVGKYASWLGVIALAIGIAINNNEDVGKKLKMGFVGCLVAALLLTAYNKVM